MALHGVRLPKALLITPNARSARVVAQGSANRPGEHDIRREDYGSNVAQATENVGVPCVFLYVYSRNPRRLARHIRHKAEGVRLSLKALLITNPRRLARHLVLASVRK